VRRLRHADTVAYDCVGWNGTGSPSSSSSPSVGLRPPNSVSTVVRTGQAWGLNTTIGVVPGSAAIAIRRLIDWIATLCARVAIADASPSWSRASS
jgi:hypothetical protein